jgi:preprotein translocase subunit SecG
MAAGLFVTSLFLSWHAGLGRHAGSIVAPVQQTGAAPTSGGVLDALRNADAPPVPRSE